MVTQSWGARQLQMARFSGLSPLRHVFSPACRVLSASWAVWGAGPGVTPPSHAAGAQPRGAGPWSRSW